MAGVVGNEHVAKPIKNLLHRIVTTKHGCSLLAPVEARDDRAVALPVADRDPCLLPVAALVERCGLDESVANSSGLERKIDVGIVSDNCLHTSQIPHE